MFHTAFVVEDGTSVKDNFPLEQTGLFARAASGSRPRLITNQAGGCG